MVKLLILDNGEEDEKEDDEWSKHTSKVDAVEVRGGSEVVCDGISKQGVH